MSRSSLATHNLRDFEQKSFCTSPTSNSQKTINYNTQIPIKSVNYHPLNKNTQKNDTEA